MHAFSARHVCPSPALRTTEPVPSIPEGVRVRVLLPPRWLEVLPIRLAPLAWGLCSISSGGMSSLSRRDLADHQIARYTPGHRGRLADSAQSQRAQSGGQVRLVPGRQRCLQKIPVGFHSPMSFFSQGIQTPSWSYSPRKSYITFRGCTWAAEHSMAERPFWRVRRRRPLLSTRLPKSGS